jgi:hypothetical protein
LQGNEIKEVEVQNGWRQKDKQKDKQKETDRSRKYITCEILRIEKRKDNRKKTDRSRKYIEL